MNYKLSVSLFCMYVFIKKISGDDQGVCYKDLGCFPITSDFINFIERPINVSPENPSKINTTFWLYSRLNVYHRQSISRHESASVKQSNFKPKAKLYIICHGFHGSSDSQILKKLAESILEVENANVVLVDWSSGAGSPYYQAVANTRVVGREIGNVLKFLQKDFHIRFHLVHLIGHSLGAHVCGYAGEWLDGKIGQITALDAAGPFFSNMPSTVRLDPSDAKFVDAIHTSTLKFAIIGLGIAQPIGHVDFYPDGGFILDKCKGISILDYLKALFWKGIEGELANFGCSHEKVVDLYIETIESKCPFVAYACEDYKSYVNGNCANCDTPGVDCSQMGFYSNKYIVNGIRNKSFYISLKQEGSVFCEYHYHVSIEVGRVDKTILTTTFYMAMLGEIAGSNTLRLNEDKRKANSTVFCSKELRNGFKQNTSVTLTAKKKC